MRASIVWSALLAAGCTGVCEVREVVRPTTGFFADISDPSGIRVDNYDEDPPEGMAINDHSRLAFADLDGDGFDDIVMHSLFPNAMNGVPFEHLVFLNDGDGTFTDHSDASGLRDVQAGFFAFGDVDNDGDQDLFAGLDLDGYADHDHAIYLNDGSGVFSKVEDSGVEGRSTIAANAVFADFDADADLDLFVGNGGTSYVGRDQLFLGNGDGTFTESPGALEGRPAQPSNGSTTCDVDNDGDQDILVSTYGVSVAAGHNHLWLNQGDATFVEAAVEWGFAAQESGNYWLEGTEAEPDRGPDEWIGSNGFGLDCGDVDNDGDMDVFLSAISHPSRGDYGRRWSDPSQLLINGTAQGEPGFTNAWLQRGLPFNEGDIDAAFVDLDHDGRLDLSISREDKYEDRYDDPEQHGWFGLMHQQPDGTFDSLVLDAGVNQRGDAAYVPVKQAQDHAWSDIDHDGDLDLLIGGRDMGGGRPNFLFRNDLGHQNRWLAVRLEGDGQQINRDAIGTRVVLDTPEGQQTRELASSRGMYNSEDTAVLHFGLGDTACSRTLEVTWPDGTTASFSRAEIPDEAYVTITYPDTLTVE